MTRHLKNYARALYRLIPGGARARLKRRIIKALTAMKTRLDPENDKDRLIGVYKGYAKEILKTGQKGEDFAEYREIGAGFAESGVKPIAFYLPQFHTFPENDAWWGRGFTEWTNVTKAVPRFVGHYQPHLPLETFYDLSDVNVMKRQAALAKNYGIYGFCFHYYWFSGGKRLLEKPLDNFLNTKDGLDIPFCLCWANENWSRKWDGSERELLMEQKSLPGDDGAVIADMSKYIRDERYIRVHGKPLVIIYNPAALPDANETIKAWRAYCRDSGIGEIYIAGARTIPANNPLVYDFDDAVEFPPHFLNMPNKRDSFELVCPECHQHVIDMEEYIEGYAAAVADSAASADSAAIADGPDRIYRCVFPTWDNTARMGPYATVAAVSPALYKKWLLAAARDTIARREAGNRFLFINAWNEWAEGAHLEPDRKYGYAYLQATAEAIGSIEN